MQIMSGAVKEMQARNKKKEERKERKKNKSREKQLEERRREEVRFLGFSLTAAV